MVGEDVAGLVAQDGAQLLAVEQLDRARVRGDRLVGADGRRVCERMLTEVEARDGRGPGARSTPVVGPRLWELVRAELQRPGGEVLAQRLLVAELDELADHGVEHRDATERGGGAVRRMLERACGDLREPLALGAWTWPSGERTSWRTFSRSEARRRPTHLHRELRVDAGKARQLGQVVHVEGLVGGLVGDRDAHDVVGKAEHAAALDDLVEGGDPRFEGLDGDAVVLQRELDVHGDLEAATDGAGVELGVVAADHAAVLERAYAPQAGRR